MTGAVRRRFYVCYFPERQLSLDHVRASFDWNGQWWEPRHNLTSIPRLSTQGTSARFG